MNPQTAGQRIASNLKACDIISGRDVERVAEQIDNQHSPMIRALERTEELLTRLRDRGQPVWQGNRDEVMGCLNDVRLALHAVICDPMIPVPPAPVNTTDHVADINDPVRDSRNSEEPD